MVTEEGWRYVLAIDGRDIELADGEVTLGRSRTATVRVDHESVSRSHALLTFRQGEAVVKDLNSSNGTYVGGRRVLNETRLSSGDKIQLGAAIVQFQMISPHVGEASERTALIDEEMSPSPPPAAGQPPEPSQGAPAPPHGAPAPIEISADELRPGGGGAGDAEKPIGVVAAAALQAVRAASALPAAPPSPSAPQPVLLDLRGTVPPPAPPAPAAPAPAPPAAAAPAPAPPAPPVRPPAVRSSAPKDLSSVPLRMHGGEEAEGEPADVPVASAHHAWVPPNLAGMPQRLLAVLVDAVILAALDLLLLSPVFLVLFLGLPRALTFWIITLLSYVVILAANFWYTVGGWAKSGRTPGKALVGLTIVTRETPAGTGVGWRVALLRALGYLLSSAIFGVGFLVALFRSDRRGWHDMLAGTWVVKAK